MAKHLFTSESVTEGHPDKICDNISDAVLDEILKQDPYGRVACETTCITNQITVMGEITTAADIDIEKIAREVVCEIGYDSDEKGFNGHTCNVTTFIDKQSSDIALGVDKSYELKEGQQEDYNLHGAGDQGMMFGYACDETPELMPLAISLSHKLAKQLTKVRKDGTLPYLRADGKTQVTVEYNNEGIPVRVDTIVISSQHSADVELETIRRDILENVIKPIIPQELFDDDTIIYVNPTGRFVTGGPAGDSGLTGRKIIVDTFGTGVLADDVLEEIVSETFDLRPAAIIDYLDLRKPIYRQLAAYGHMGREELGVKWELTDKKDILRQKAGI